MTTSRWWQKFRRIERITIRDFSLTFDKLELTDEPTSPWIGGRPARKVPY